ncbi:MAG: YceI family protein [Bacteroidota bacterium]|jgi:polyisoprenoid-binding protein YceI|nr:YceI family protein [Bacteroidota bacterium]
MQTTLTTLAAVAAFSLGLTAQTNWNVDASHSKLGFAVTHMMVSETEGKFKIYEGKVTSEKEGADFTNAKIDFSIDAASINTDDEKRDGHLRSADFFDVEKYPKITFKSTSMKPGKVKGTYTLTGDLTMHGVTKPVVLTAIGASKIVKDPYGMERYAFKVNGKLNRKDFGLTWNAALEAGGVAVSDEVRIDITIELTKAK